MTERVDSGRVGVAETGSREPTPSSSGLGPSGFDPARGLEYVARAVWLAATTLRDKEAILSSVREDK